MMAATGANQFSSRSHAILIISVENRNKTRELREEVIYSKLQIIDLAGSERAASTENRG
jgi:kinesin family member 18/19